MNDMLKNMLVWIVIAVVVAIVVVVAVISPMPWPWHTAPRGHTFEKHAPGPPARPQPQPRRGLCAQAAAASHFETALGT